MLGWLATRSGKNELSKTMDVPKLATAMTTIIEPRKYVAGTTNTKQMHATDPVYAKMSSSFLRQCPYLSQQTSQLVQE